MTWPRTYRIWQSIVLIHVVTALQERVPPYMRSEVDLAPPLWEGVESLGVGVEEAAGHISSFLHTTLKRAVVHSDLAANLTTSNFTKMTCEERTKSLNGTITELRGNETALTLNLTSLEESVKELEDLNQEKRDKIEKLEGELESLSSRNRMIAKSRLPQ